MQRKCCYKWQTKKNNGAFVILSNNSNIRQRQCLSPYHHDVRRKKTTNLQHCFLSQRSMIHPQQQYVLDFSSPTANFFLLSNNNQDVFNDTSAVLGIFSAAILIIIVMLLKDKTLHVVTEDTEKQNRNTTEITLESLEDDEANKKNQTNNNTTATVEVFDQWKEMSRPENYILYSTRIKKKMPKSLNNPLGNSDTEKKLLSSLIGSTTNTKKKRLVLTSLLILFLPLSSIELFFALSRQFLCNEQIPSTLTTDLIIDDDETTNNQLSTWTRREFCSPYFEQNDTTMEE